jgi:hypothetical protein
MVGSPKDLTRQTSRRSRRCWEHSVFFRIPELALHVRSARGEYPRHV